MVTRRRTLAALGAGLAWVPLRTLAQPRSKPALIGYLAGGGRANFPLTVDQFRLGMRELGYVEGKDYVLELRTAEGKIEMFPSLAEELVKRKVDIAVSTTTSGAAALKRASNTIPIVLCGS